MREHEYYVDGDNIRVMRTPKGSTCGNDQRVVALCATDAGGMDVAVRIAEMLNGSRTGAPQAPEPVADWRTPDSDKPDEVAAAYARSATSRSEPLSAVADTTAWIDFADNGNVRFWTAHAQRADDERTRGRHLRAFTLAELIALASKAPIAAPPVRSAASTVEPVRWLITWPDGETGISKVEPVGDRWPKDCTYTPLYAATTTSPEPDAVRERDIDVATDAIVKCPAFSDFSAPPGFCARDMATAVVAALSRPAHVGPDQNDGYYLGVIRKRLEQLYEEHPDDARLREQVSDECDWIDAALARNDRQNGEPRS